MVWSGTFDFNSTKNYTFSTFHDDGMRVYIDGQKVYDNWLQQSAQTRTFSQNMVKGVHDIKVEYWQRKGFASAKLSWS